MLFLARYAGMRVMVTMEMLRLPSLVSLPNPLESLWFYFIEDRDLTSSLPSHYSSYPQTPEATDKMSMLVQTQLNGQIVLGGYFFFLLFLIRSTLSFGNF